MSFEDKKPGRGLALILGGEPDDDEEAEENDGVTAAKAFDKAQKAGDHAKMFAAFKAMSKANDSEPEEEEEESDEGDEPKEELDFGK